MTSSTVVKLAARTLVLGQFSLLNRGAETDMAARGLGPWYLTVVLG